MAPNNFKTFIGSIRRKPTNAPDRKTDEQAGAAQIEKSSLLHDVTHLGAKNTRTMAQALTTLASGEPLNDKELLLENGVSMLQSLPVNSGLSSTVSDGFIKMLYHDLPHPPGTISGPTTRYRRHDGGNNNPWLPEMGKAWTPYSRSVPPVKTKGPNLPDPELVFEQLLKRKGPFREHESGLNRLFFSFATIVIHECFQTNRENQWINETSSYVDLSTLYGNTEREQPRVRTYKNGLLYPDSIASERIMLMPPGVVAILVLFSRNHNSIVESLLSINEDGKYGDWETLDEEKRKWQDEDLFQLGRNINVGFFAAVVLHDYVAAILNTPRANSEWTLDLGKEIKSAGTRVERGTGNVVSVEFAVLYHWHAALSAADATWMEDLLKWHLGEDLDLEKVGPKDFYTVVMKEGAKLEKTLPKDWTFDKFKRKENGRFDDYELAELIKDCINEPAHAFGAHGTPASLKVVDLMGQLQARNVFNVCTMNEFRRYLNLKAYESFEEWNPDKTVARAAELLYGHIENLELYPGLMAECTKPAMPGSGVCPGQTTGRGILDDAVALVRGDRFLSYDFNSNTLTNWGFGQLTTQPGSYGGTLPLLLFRGLPSAFTGTSSWGLLPFYTPKAAKEILKGNKALEKYNTERPRSDGELIAIHTQEGCKKALADHENFRILYPAALKNTATGQEFLLSPSNVATASARSSAFQKAFFEDNFEQNLIKFFREKTASLIAECDLEYPDTRRAIDIVRDVTNYVPILWLAQRFAIPLKTMEQPRGLITPPRLLEIFQALFLYQNANWLPAVEWKLRADAETEAPKLQGILEGHLKTQSGGFKEQVVDWIEKGTAFEAGPDADRLFHELMKTKVPPSELAGDCIGVSTLIAGNLTAQASLLIDLYLSQGYEQYKTQIIELAQKDDAESWKQLKGFVLEGIRHAAAVPGLARVAAKDVTINDGARGPISIKAQQKVLIATSKAAMDPAVFPSPEKIDPTRQTSQPEAYSILGHGSNYSRIAIPALAAILKEVFKLKNIGRERGRAGKFTIVERDLSGVALRSYLDANAKESPTPTTLRLMYNV